MKAIGEIVLQKFGVAGLIFFMWYISQQSNKEELKTQAQSYHKIIEDQSKMNSQNFKILHEMLEKMNTFNERLGNIELRLKFQQDERQ